MLALCLDEVMDPQPSGQLRKSGSGRDLMLVRTFDAPIEAVWAMFTEPERTASWFATWKGEAVPGGTIEFTMTFEEGATAQQMTIKACEPPRHLEVNAVDEYGSWHLELDLEDQGTSTTLQFTHHLDKSANPGQVGPGWEYYLDNLMAAYRGTPSPSFDDYFPAQQPFYDNLDRALRTSG